MAIQNIITERNINNTSTDEVNSPRSPQITNVTDSRDVDNTSRSEVEAKASQSVSNEVNENSAEDLSEIRVFGNAVANACLNSNYRIVEAGVKERGYKADGNPEEGNFRVGLKPTPEETVASITSQALFMAYDVINDNAVLNACVWGAMSIEEASQDETYAYINFSIS